MAWSGSSTGLKAWKYREQIVGPAPGGNPWEGSERTCRLHSEIWTRDVLAVRRQR